MSIGIKHAAGDSLSFSSDCPAADQKAVDKHTTVQLQQASVAEWLARLTGV